MVKLVNMFTGIYAYSLYGNINMNYGNYVLLRVIMCYSGVTIRLLFSLTDCHLVLHKD